jgi:hypothetical protein
MANNPIPGGDGGEPLPRSNFDDARLNGDAVDSCMEKIAKNSAIDLVPAPQGSENACSEKDTGKTGVHR